MHRDEILKKILEELRSYPQVNLIAEGGAKAFNRFDELSDLDLMVDAEDGTVEETVKSFEDFLERLAGISSVYAAKTEKQNQHKFYKLKDAGKFSIVDLFITERSNPKTELDKYIHGNFVVHYDRYGFMIDQKFDRELLNKNIEDSGIKSKAVFEFFLYQTEKEIIRGRYIDALAYYFDLTIKPLIRSLRIKYNPVHYNFELRYLYDEFPAGLVKEIEELLSIRDINDLKIKLNKAEEIYKREIFKGM
ncbi:MAG: hypothetical protein JSS91_14755 [Bacteroidetes bacterium]|nr:hypothetical protein [Bacteroidota bacterium]